MIAVLHSTEQNAATERLLADLSRFGIPSKVYGLGERFQNWGDKLRTAYKAACEYPNEVLLFLDAWDVRVIAPVDVISISCPMFCAEKGCFPDADLAEKYPPGKSPWRFLNAGVSVAIGRDIKHIVEAHGSIIGTENDQRYWTRRFLDGEVAIDDGCHLFQSCAFSCRGNWATYGGKLVNLTTMSTPAVLHFNGQTTQWEPDGLTGLQHEKARWQDTEENAKQFVDEFSSMVGSTPWLMEHRSFAEHGYGCGDRSFHWLWHLLVGEMPAEFKFLEVGVYKGQVLSLVQLLANQWHKQAGITGVTMLSDFSGSKGDFPRYEDRDYLADIKAVHDAFTLNFDPAMLVVGDSTADWVVSRTKERGPFDLVYIDGCHEYEYVKADIRNYGAMVKPGGYLVMDDAANDCKQPWGFFQGIEQVTRAVRETICADPQWEHVVTVMHNRVFRRVK